MSADKAVDHVFSVLAATYGSAWDKSLGQAPIADVKTIWANMLDGFMHSESAKKSILWALKNLPERVPNSIQFRDLCRQSPAQETKLLPEPKADPERVKAELAKLAPLREKAKEPVNHDFKAWAKAIVANPKGRTPTVIAMAKKALEAA